jgi:hypothetical protein
MAGARFHSDGFQTLVASLTTPDSAITLTNGSSVHRIWLYEVNMGNIGTPADLTSVYYIGQVTDAGASGGAITATAIEDGTTNSKVAISVVHGNLTTEPTYVGRGGSVNLTTPANGDLLRVPLNHRATYRWVAPPGGEFVAPALANDGFGGIASHASATTDYMIGFHWIE